MLCSNRWSKSAPRSTVFTLLALSLLASQVFAQIEIRTVDFNEAIQAHARDSELPDEQARAEALRYLLSPRPGVELSSFTTDELRPGVFEIQAPTSFHDAVTATMGWLRHGKKQIVIELRFIQVSSATRSQLHAEFADAWVTSATVDQEDLDGLLPKATPAMGVSSGVATSPLRFASAKSPVAPPVEFVSATTQTVRATPCRVAKLTADQVAKFQRSQENDPASNWMCAPKITVFPEQDALIQDTTQRPFVVSVKPVTENGKTVIQPVIQVFDDGVTLHVRATPRDGHLELVSKIVFSEIGDVETFTFTPHGLTKPVTVQIPDQQRRQVDLTQQLETGTSLLVDSGFFQETTVKKRFRADVTTRHYSLLLISAHIIEEDAIKSDADEG